jgi:hypothetical protein
MFRTPELDERGQPHGPTAYRANLGLVPEIVKAVKPIIDVDEEALRIAAAARIACASTRHILGPDGGMLPLHVIRGK